MNRKDYTTARRLLRDNGRYALRWLPADQAAVMDRLMFSTTRDDLAERAFASEYDRRRVRHLPREHGGAGLDGQDLRRMAGELMCLVCIKQTIQTKSP